MDIHFTLGEQELSLGKFGHLVRNVQTRATLEEGGLHQGDDHTAKDDEIVRLRAEIAALRASLAKRQSSLQAANEARSARSAQVDAMVAGIAQRLPQQFHDPWHRGVLRQKVTKLLNKREIPAPRGGRWTTKQVQRALDRHADRKKKQHSP